MKQPPRRKKAGFFVRSTVLTVMVPYVLAASFVLWAVYIVTLKAYTGTHDVFRINGYGYAAEGSEEANSKGYNEFYAYDVKAGKHDLCSFAWTRTDIVYKNGKSSEGIDYDAKVPFKWRMDELPLKKNLDEVLG